MELGTKWNDCVLVYSSNKQKLLDGVHLDAFNQYYHRFLSPFGLEGEYNVWYDNKSKSCFSGAQFSDTKNAGKFQHFFSPKSRFVKIMNQHLSPYLIDRPWAESAFKNEHLTVDKNMDYMCTKLDLLKSRFKDKKILIVGGGPSTNSVSWENLQYDSLWTCNEFYKNNKLKNKKVDFVSFAPLVDDSLNSSGPLENAVRDNKNMIVSFPIDRSGYKYKPVLDFAEKYIDRTCLYQTRYSSVVGTMNRLICLAVFLEAKEIMFVGMDGRAKQESNGDLLHAFDGDKPVPNWYKTYGDRFQDRQFVIFYDYIMGLKERYSFKLYNIGEGQKFNASTEITKKAFPLTDEIKGRINYDD